MARTQTMVQLSDELVRALDDLARRRGVSRSSLIRDAVSEVLADDLDARTGEQIAEGYRRIPPGTPDEWGDLDAQTDLATVELGRQLDAEERRSHTSW
jgi:predicted transcriptional regulator